MPETDETHINVGRCPACSKSHERVLLAELKSGHGPFTHWYQCPELGDPVQTTIVVFDEGQHSEVNKEIVASAVNAQKAGRYLWAIFHLDEKDKLFITSGWQNFVSARIDDAGRLLVEDFRRRVDAPPPQIPLKRVGKLPPMVNLFGAKGNDQPPKDEEG